MGSLVLVSDEVGRKERGGILIAPIPSPLAHRTRDARFAREPQWGSIPPCGWRVAS